MTCHEDSPFGLCRLTRVVTDPVDQMKENLIHGLVPAPRRAGLAPVTDKKERGAALTQRRVGLGVHSVKEFSERTGVSREAVAKAERGAGSPGTYQRLEGWLDSQVPPEHDHDVVEFDITGPVTKWHFSVRGPADQADELREQVVKLVRELEPGD
jgi:transcriptional regulator with XRE-family HTH domain